MLLRNVLVGLGRTTGSGGGMTGMTGGMGTSGMSSAALEVSYHVWKESAVKVNHVCNVGVGWE